MSSQELAPLPPEELTTKWDGATDEQAIQLWLERCESPHTRRAYKRESGLYLEWLGQQGKSLRTALDGDLRAYKDHLHTVRELEPRSMRFSISVLKALYAFLVKRHYARFNPAEDTKLPSLPPRAIATYFTHDECDYIYRAICQKGAEAPNRKAYIRKRWVFCLTFLSGLRREEIANAKTNNLSFQLGPVGKAWWLDVTGKGSKIRRIALSPMLMEEMGIYRAAYGLPPEPSPAEEYGLVFRLGGPDLQQRSSAPVSSYTIYEIMANLFKELLADCTNDILAMKLEAASIHWMRHSYSTAFLDKIGDMRMLQENLGHSDIKTTAIYSHVQEERMQLAASRMRLAGPDEDQA